MSIVEFLTDVGLVSFTTSDALDALVTIAVQDAPTSETELVLWCKCL